LNLSALRDALDRPKQAFWRAWQTGIRRLKAWGIGVRHGPPDGRSAGTGQRVTLLIPIPAPARKLPAHL